MREPAIHHCTSEPLHFFGRHAELALLDGAVSGGEPSVVGFVGPGGQGKTAIVQHWLKSRAGTNVDGCFLWSFYRGKESDLCLRWLFAYAEGLSSPPDVSASFCVDRLIPRLRSERWAIVLDGTEVVQHEQGSWRGRFLHPELGRLIETLAEAPMPGVVALTTRFELPTLATRRHARLVSLGTLDDASAAALLVRLGVRGSAEELAEATRAAGGHAKAVELLGSWLVAFHEGRAVDHECLPVEASGGRQPGQDRSQEIPVSTAGFGRSGGLRPPLADSSSEPSDEERHVLRILNAFHETLSQDVKDVVALATHFHQPPTETCLVDYLRSEPVRRLLHGDWGRSYRPFADRDAADVKRLLQTAIDLRLLERVGLALARGDEEWTKVIDAHPLVRRGFENVLAVRSASSAALAGFLRGRPDRKTPANIVEAREDVELFHAFCAAGTWTEADDALRALDNPKHRFLAPAFERDLLLRFFPEGDWRRPPLWPGFGRYRSLAICCEMLGQFDEALAIYRPADAALRGDALIALGRLDEIINTPFAAHPWQSLWQAYRAHALALAGRSEEALRAVTACWPVDVYEWAHAFETLVRLGRLDLFDPRSLDAALRADESQWTALTRRRIRADWFRLTGAPADVDLDAEYRELTEAYDRAGLPVERVLVRLSHGRSLNSLGRREAALAITAREIAQRFQMPILRTDAETVFADDRSRGRP